MGSITLTNFCLLNNPYWDKYWWAMVSHLFFKCITRFELLILLLDICVPVFMSAFLLPYDVFMIFLKLIYTVQQWSQSRLDFLSTSLLLLSSVSCHTCIFIFYFLMHGFILYVFFVSFKEQQAGSERRRDRVKWIFHVWVHCPHSCFDQRGASPMLGISSKSLWKSHAWI